MVNNDPISVGITANSDTVFIMTIKANWVDLGEVLSLKAEIKSIQVKEIKIGSTPIALSYRDGQFGAISGACNHAGGPLGKGRLDGDYIICPWHYWKFHRSSGQGEPGFEEDRVPSYEVRIENDHLFLNTEPAQSRNKKPHPAHPLSRPVKRADGPIRVVGISTTAMTLEHPRYSTSEELLKYGLRVAKEEMGAETRLIQLGQLKIRNCEGFYSKSAGACTWPCSITQMDSSDEMEQVYEAMVHWADVIVLATPVRWGSAGSLYYKMVERLNCVQNQITLHDKLLIEKKVASFIITGGQDNIQAVAGQALGFFAEIGFVFPPFPYVAHSLGWTAENMERNVSHVAKSKELRAGTAALVRRAIETAQELIKNKAPSVHLERGGRKARRMETETTEVNINGGQK